MSMEDCPKYWPCCSHINYWKDRLKSTPITDLLPDWQLSLEKSDKGSIGVKKFAVDSSTTQSLKHITSGLRKTLFCILLALHKVTIWKMTGQEDQVIIALHTGMFNAGFKSTIGNNSMEIAYKASLSGNPSFIEITERISHTMKESLFHQPVPIDWIRRELSNDGISFRAPGMSFIPDSTRKADGILQHLRFNTPAEPHGCHGFPVSYSLDFREIRETIEVSMTYGENLYSELTIDTFLDHFRQNISEVINNQNKKLYDFKRDLNFTYY